MAAEAHALVDAYCLVNVTTEGNSASQRADASESSTKESFPSTLNTKNT